MDLKERFLKYVSYDTQSSEESETFPSTEKQKVLLEALRDEMLTLGMTEVTMDRYGYVMGTVPASKGYENAPVIGFIAHVDTSPDMSGKDVKPRVVEEYDGGDLVLNGHLTMRVEEFPELAFFKGHTLIHTDGTTLLGADDKAGIAEIMTLIEQLAVTGAPHGRIAVCFTPDEEVGRGTACFDLERFGADFAYTVDGGPEGEIVCENFNASSATVDIRGVNVHTGSAKDTMVNAALVAMEFNSLLPAAETPRHTELREGFYHLTGVEGCCESACARYILRDHDAAKLAMRGETLMHAAKCLNEKYGEGTVTVTLHAGYRNMLDKILPQHAHLIDNAKLAARRADVEPFMRIMRGGTDGAELSWRGLPCPNLGTGGYAYHGPYEHITVEGMDKCVEILKNLTEIYSSPLPQS